MDNNRSWTECAAVLVGILQVNKAQATRRYKNRMVLMKPQMWAIQRLFELFEHVDKLPPELQPQKPNRELLANTAVIVNDLEPGLLPKELHF